MDVISCKKIPTFDHICDNLYLGDVESATSLNIIDRDIEIIVNVSNSRYVEFDGIDYYHYDIDDDSSVNIGEYFDRFVKLVENNKNKNILVHCQNSVSRSVTLVLAYLISSGKTLVDAFEFVKSKRTQYTCPNKGFLKQLSVYEMQIHGEISIEPLVLFKKNRK